MLYRQDKCLENKKQKRTKKKKELTLFSVMRDITYQTWWGQMEEGDHRGLWLGFDEKSQ